MARVFSESAWKSDKIFNIKPIEWRAEYAWVYSIALADGTFEASARLVWMAAYASIRPDWDVEKVGQLLDEFERVGLLRRATDTDSKVWGWWVGSDKFLPTPERCEKKRYKTGRRDLFTSAGAAPTQPRCSPDAPPEQPRRSPAIGVGVGRGCGEGLGKGKDVGVDCAAKDSENEQQPEQVKSVEASSPNTVETTATPRPEDFTNRMDYGTACHNAGVMPVSRAEFKRRRPVLPPAEYTMEKMVAAASVSRPSVDAAVASFAAELAARAPCPRCGIKHIPHCEVK